MAEAKTKKKSSEEKRHAKSLAARLVNRSRKSQVKTARRKTLAAVEAGNSAEARKLLGETASLVDRAAKGSTLHQRTAARIKSRLAKRVARAGAKARPGA